MRFPRLMFAVPLVLIACAPAPGGSSSSAASSETVSSSAAVTRYEDTGIGYSIGVPAGWTTAEDKELNAANYQAKGTAFVAPPETGTTLDEAYFHVSQAATCPEPPASRAASESVTIAGVPFQKSTWSDGAAGNLYEGVMYAGPKDAGCFVLTGYLHSCNLGVDCGAGHSTPFQKEAYLSTFDAMAKSVQFLAHPGD